MKKFLVLPVLVYAQKCQLSQFDDDIVTVCDGKQIAIGDKIANGKECTFECAISEEVLIGKATGTCTDGNLERPYCMCNKCCPKEYKYIDGLSLTCTNNPLNMKKSKCAMTCEEGTILQGDEKLKCVEGVTGWDWDGKWPTCMPDTDDPATTVLPTTKEPTATTIVITTDASTEQPTTKPPTTEAPATTIIATTTEVIENTGLIGLSKVSEALDGIKMEWNENLQDPGTGAAVQSQVLRVISTLYSLPKVISLSIDASSYQLTNVVPGIVYQIELVVTFKNGAMYSGAFTARVEPTNDSNTPMQCAVCHSIEGNDACNASGLTCDATKNQVCQTVVRAENKKPARFEKRCKQKIACENERAIYKSMGLCGGGSRRKYVDVCVHCCEGNLCNLTGAWAEDTL